MEDIPISIVAECAEYLVESLLRHASYMFGFNKIVRNFHDKKEELILTRRSVNVRMNEATRNAEIIADAKERWMDDVSSVLKEVEKLEENTRENIKCYHVPFQYLLAKKVARVTEKMTKLNSYNFGPFYRHTDFPASSKNILHSTSTKRAYNELIEALKDRKNHMIGLHGMGGTGKSTLVKKVGIKVAELKLFDKVVMAVVSHNSEVTNIQDQIADSLGLRLMEETPVGRARRLSYSLGDWRTLVILDDVKEKLNLEAIGVPECCTVLLNTRGEDICVSMNCQITVELPLMDEDEAWTIFKLCAGITDDSAHALKNNVGRKIAKKCKGRLIAIVAMASMLREKKDKEWDSALHRLEKSQPIDVEEELGFSHAFINLSYDYLTENVSQILFLLCSMFPEGCEINVEDLVRCMMTLGSATTGSMEKVRKEIQLAIHTLRDKHLLEPIGQDEFVKMHDMVHDVALWIASKEGKVATSMLAETDENIKELTEISLWGMDNHPPSFLVEWTMMGNHPPIDQLKFPKLRTLLLHSVDGSSLQLARMYFEGMPKLEVLGIIKFYYTWRNLYTLRNLSSSLSILIMPQSIGRLTMLRNLCLRGYELGDISVLASLKRLEVLDLRSSSFHELPQGIGSLKKLRLLDIYTCRIKKNNHYEVIGKCVHLEELYAWRIENDSLHIVSLPTLHRFVIVCDKIRENCRFLIDAYLEEHVPSKALCIDKFDASALIHESSSIKKLFRKAEHLYLGQVQGGCKNIIPHMDLEGMTEVVGLILESCSEIECLLDIAFNLPAFSNLVILKLIWMNGLKEVFSDPTSQCSLENLEDLQIEYCVQLKSISFPRKSNLCNLKILRLQWCPMLTSSLFIPAVAQCLVLLEELKLFDCSKLKHIIGEEHEEDGNANNPSPTLKVFSNLRILHVHGCQRLESIFPIAFAQNLERLEKIAIWYNSELKYVFGTHRNYKGNENEARANINLHSLRTISLVSLSNLIDICPKYCHPRSLNLKEIEYRDCPRMSVDVMCKTLISSDMQEGLIATEEKVVFPENWEPVLALECLAIQHSMVEGIFQLQAAEERPLNSNLSHLCLKDLPELRLIWKGPKVHLSLHKLKSLVLVGCKNLEIIFFPSIVGCLAELRELVVSKCEKLEQIIYSDQAAQVGNASACSESVCFPLLSIVHVYQCNNLKRLFSHSLASPFPKLEFITVEECSKIEHVFYFNEDDRGHEVRPMFDQDKQHLVLLELREVKLICLPNFTEFFRGPYKLLQKVKHTLHYTVRNCPKYTYDLQQTESQEKSQISSTLTQKAEEVCDVELGSSSTSAPAAATNGGAGGDVSDPQIQERASNLETNEEFEIKRERVMESDLEFEQQKLRLMELDLQVERERRRLIELRLEAEQERRRIMEKELLSVLHEMFGRVSQEFAAILSQNQLAPKEESEE